VLELGRLLAITERVLRDPETDEDLAIIFAPGSPLGGARPKALGPPKQKFGAWPAHSNTMT
jgi:hypothetical protein